MIHNILLYGGSIAIAAMFLVIGHSLEALATHVPCDEIAEVVNEHPDLLTQAEADRIVEACNTYHEESHK